MQRLNERTLTQTGQGVITPAYDRAALRPGILHLGLGAFHRVHLAVFTEQAIANSGGDWGIIGVSLRSDAVSRQLLPQDCLYSVASEGPAGCELRVIGALCDVLVAPREPHRVLDAIADPAIAIVTLTITEKGYCLGDDGHTLDRADSVIAADLEDPNHPSSAVGLLALGLRQRRAAGGAPLTIISCDNLSDNSRRLHGVLVEYLGSCFPDLLGWLEDSVAFPCSMVDRIAPAMTPQQMQRQAEWLGLVDQSALRTEPFKQWIIEDCFATAHPDWESAGVRLVKDIGPYEQIKLRLLNAAHSTIAYSGLLAGLETVDQVMCDPVLEHFVADLMHEELMPTLAVPAGFDLESYGRQLLERFANASLGHRCEQIAMDGSEKISQRWLPTLQSGAPCPRLSRALATWCYFILHTDLAIEDPRGGQLLDWRVSGASARGRLQGVLSCARITPASVGSYEQLCTDLEHGIALIASAGVRGLLSSPLPVQTQSGAGR